MLMLTANYHGTTENPRQNYKMSIHPATNISLEERTEQWKTTLSVEEYCTTNFELIRMCYIYRRSARIKYIIINAYKDNTWHVLLSVILCRAFVQFGLCMYICLFILVIVSAYMSQLYPCSYNYVYQIASLVST